MTTSGYRIGTCFPLSQVSPLVKIGISIGAPKVELGE